MQYQTEVKLLLHMLKSGRFSIAVASNLTQIILLEYTCLRYVSHQTLVAITVLSVAFADSKERVPQQKLV